MKVADLKKLPEGTVLELNLGQGWWARAEFVRLVKTTKFPSLTFSDLCNGDFDLSKGKQSYEAVVIYDGKKMFVSPRKLYL